MYQPFGEQYCPPQRQVGCLKNELGLYYSSLPISIATLLKTNLVCGCLNPANVKSSVGTSTASTSMRQ